MRTDGKQGHVQGGVTYILTVGRSATGVKLKGNGQGVQKLSNHRSNKKLTVKKQNENFNPQSNKTNLLKVYEFILDYTVFIITFRLALCMRLRLRDL